MREIASELNEAFWLQLYMIKDRAFLKEMLAIGREAGCSALLLTVDLPVSGSRYRDVRSGLSVPGGVGASFRRFCQSMLRPGWAWVVGLKGRPHSLGNLEPVLGANSGLEDYFGWIAANFDPSIGPARLLYAFEAVIIGGLGSLWGTLAGGIVLGLAQTIGARIDPEWQILAGHLAFLAVLMVRSRVANDFRLEQHAAQGRPLRAIRRGFPGKRGSINTC